MATEKQLTRLTNQLRRIEIHREADTEDEVKKACQSAYNELLGILGSYYAKCAGGEGLSGSDLRRAGVYKAFFQEVVDKTTLLSKQQEKTIRKAIEDTYTACYDGMVDAVKDAAGDNARLRASLSGLTGTTPEAVKEIIESPSMDTTLAHVFKNAADISTHDIKQTLAVGLAQGDSYQRMAKRVSESINKSYRKCLTVTRTECNRAINQGFQNAAEAANQHLQGAGYVETKTWHSMQDELVRDTHASLDGETVYITDVFHSSGAAADCPGDFGEPSEDINCRCFLEYALMPVQEFLATGGVLPAGLTYDAERGMIVRDESNE